MALLPIAHEDRLDLIEAEAAILRDKNIAGLQTANATPVTGPRPHQCAAALRRQPAQTALSRKDIITQALQTVCFSHVDCARALSF
jgi:hypothetical protein